MNASAWTTPCLSRATPSSLVVGLHLHRHEHSIFEVQSRALPDIDINVLARTEDKALNAERSQDEIADCDWQDHGTFEGHSQHTLIPLQGLKPGTQYQVRCRMKPLREENDDSASPTQNRDWTKWSGPSQPLRTCSELTTQSVFSDSTRSGSEKAWRYKFWSATASQWMAKPVVSCAQIHSTTFASRASLRCNHVIPHTTGIQPGCSVDRCTAES
jgi:hypothetical protein